MTLINTVMKKLGRLLLGVTTDAPEDTTDTLSISILQPRVQNLYDAMGMAEWAINSTSIGDFCNRAEIFGRFIAYYDDQEEAREALTFYTESICQKQEMACWLRRDILFEAIRYLLEPEIEEVYECMMRNEFDGAELCEELDAYVTAREDDRIEVMKTLSPTAQKALSRYLERQKHYEAHAMLFQELVRLEEAIQCEKYGI